MASQLEITNMALSHIGARDRVASLVENSQEAVSASLWYGLSRQMSLEAYDWNFARKRVALTEDAAAPPTGEWGWRFVYPSDCLKARQIQNPGVPYVPMTYDSHRFFVQPDAIPFMVELSPDGLRRTILVDLEEPDLIYTSDVTDTTLFSPYFTMSLSYALAHNLCYKLTGKQQLADRMFQLFLNSIRTAAMYDANEQVERAPRESEFIRGRF